MASEAVEINTRKETLQLALMHKSDSDTTEQIISNADKFASYILKGK